MPKIDPPVLRQGTLAELEARRASGEPSWEPLIGEPPRTYAMFLGFLKRRDFEQVARAFEVSKQAVYDASHRWYWRERMRDYHRYLARQLVEHAEYEIAEGMNFALSYLKRTLLNASTPQALRVRCAEILLRYSPLGRSSSGRVDGNTPRADAGRLVGGILSLVAAQPRQQTPVDAKSETTCDSEAVDDLSHDSQNCK